MNAPAVPVAIVISDLVTSVVYSVPPPWVPSGVVLKRNGWFKVAVSLYKDESDKSYLYVHPCCKSNVLCLTLSTIK